MNPLSSGQAGESRWPPSNLPASVAHPRKNESGGQSPNPDVTAMLLMVLRRWWKLAVPIGLVLGTFAAGVAYLVVKPEYEAKALIRISEITPYIVFSDPVGRNAADASRFVKTQMEILRSPLVLGPVVGKREIAGLPEVARLEDPVAELAPLIGINSVGGSELLNISFKGPDPEHAAQILKAITAAYFSLTEQNDATRTARVIQLLELESSSRQTEVTKLRENVRELTILTTGRDPFAAATPSERNVAQPLAELQKRLTTTSVEKAVLQAQVTAGEEWSGQPPAEAPAASVQRAVEEHIEVQRLKAQIAEKQKDLRQIEVTAARGRQDPLYANAEQKLAQANEALEKLRSDLQPSLKAEMEAASATRRAADLAEMQARLQGMELMQRALEKQHAEQLKNLKQFSGDTVEMEFKRDELTRAQNVYDRIVTRIVALRTERSAPARVELLIDATAPKLPRQKFPYLPMGFCLLGGFCGPFLLLGLWEWRTCRVSDTAQLKHQTNLVVIGEITQLPSHAKGLDAASGRVGRHLRLFRESIDSLRTSLMLSQPPDGMHVLAVTSASSHEGKTTVAAQLAISIAHSTGENTLLIDADMRDPDLHDVFGTDLGPGLSQVLDHQTRLDEAVVATRSQHLDLLPAGRLRTSPHRLLGNGALRSLLDEARKKYRYVVIDTPPVLPASESLVLAKAADATLFCVMRDVSRMAQVRTAFDRLLAAGARPAGVVFNSVPASTYAYTYGEYGPPQHEDRTENNSAISS